MINFIRPLECPKLQAFLKKYFLKLDIALYHIMPFAKIIGLVKRNRTKRRFPPFFLDLKIDIFPLEYMQNQDLVVFMFQGENISNFKSRKDRKNFHKTLFKAHK